MNFDKDKRYHYRGNLVYKEFLHNQKVVPRKRPHVKDNNTKIPIEKDSKTSLKNGIVNFLFVVNWLVLFAIFGSYFYYSNSLIKIKILKNTSPYSQAELSKTLNINLKSFNQIDSFNLSKQLNDLPWVKHAKLKKMPPFYGGLVVDGRTPVSVIETNNQKLMIDDNQVILENNVKNIIPGLPIFKIDEKRIENFNIGAKLNNLSINWAFDWLDNLEGSTILPATNIESIDITNPFYFMINTFDKKTFVVTYNNIDQQIKRLNQTFNLIINNLQQNKDSSTIDLRITDRVILR